MAINNTQLANWASTVCFKALGDNVYRGSVNTVSVPSVEKALTEYGLTKAFAKEGFAVWSSQDDKDVVLLNWSSI